MSRLTEIWGGVLSEFHDGLQSRSNGAQYARSGNVKTIEIGETAINAKVAGQRLYSTKLTIRNGTLTGHCSCPMGRYGDFCKHCVAVAIVASHELFASNAEEHAADSATPPPPTPAPTKSTVTQEQLRSHLLSWEKTALVDLLFKTVAPQSKEMDAIRLDILASRGSESLLGHFRDQLVTAAETVADSVTDDEDDDYHSYDRYGTVRLRL